MTNNINQTEKEIDMQNELDIVAEKLKNKTYHNYCGFEDESYDLIVKNCPICKQEIDNTGVGISILMANIRNYIRFKGNIKFKIRSVK